MNRVSHAIGHHGRCVGPPPRSPASVGWALVSAAFGVVEYRQDRSGEWTLQSQRGPSETESSPSQGRRQPGRLGETCRAVGLLWLYLIVLAVALIWGPGWARRALGLPRTDQQAAVAAMHGDAEGIRQALTSGAAVDAQPYGWTPLMYMAARGDVPTVQLLLRAGAKPQAVGSGGDTPLLAAQRAADPAPVVRLLIAAGADVNTADEWGATPLMLAADHGHIEVVRLLLEAGADAGAADTEGQTARVWAARHGYTELTDLLARWERDTGSLGERLTSGHPRQRVDRTKGQSMATSPLGAPAS